MDEQKTLFLWSAGGLSGADMGVGIWLALEEAGIHADANAGTSAGAILAALNSAGYTAAAVEELIRSLSDGSIRRERPLWKLRIPWIDHFLLHDPVRELLRENLPERFVHLAKPLAIAVTDEDSDEPRYIEDGSLGDAVLASMSISGVWPAVDLSNLPGGPFSDGGTTAYLPVPPGMFPRYERILVILTRQNLAYDGGNMISRLIHNAHVLQENQIDRTLDLLTAQHPNVLVLRPPLRTRAGMLHFDHNLIGEAYVWARSELRAGRNA